MIAADPRLKMMIYCATQGIPLETTDCMEMDELEAFMVILGNIRDSSAVYDWTNSKWIENG